MFALDLAGLTYPMILFTYFEFDQISFVIAQVIIQQSTFLTGFVISIFFTMAKSDGSRKVQPFLKAFLVTELLSITDCRHTV
jgi:hypothetical protein